MGILDVIQRRYSVRAYQPRAVEDEKLRNVLEAGRLAPSARNVQEWRFIVVRDDATRARLVPATNNQAFVGQAPVVIACCSILNDYVMRGGQLAAPIDLAIAIDHMTLQAVAEGLGTCWIGSFIEEQVKAILDIPPAVRVISLLTLGYPADQQRPGNRLSMDKIVAHEKWAFD